MLTPEIESKIREASIEEYYRNREACGLIISGKFLQVENTAKDPVKDFRIESKHLAAKGIEAIWHSHTNDNETLSASDIIPCFRHQIPFVLYLVKANKFKIFDPRPNSNYLDREPCPGINDCWSLIDHWYKFEMGIDLPKFDRKELITTGWSALDDPEWNMFRENIAVSGFNLISLEDDLKRGDVLLFQIGTAVSSHVGVLVDPIEGLFAHQLLDRPSRIDRLTGSWRDALMSVGRHKDALK